MPSRGGLLTSRPRLVGAGLIVAVTVATGLWALRLPLTYQDEVSLLIYPDLVAHGRIPNHDFFTPYGPGTYWPLTAVYWLTGSVSVTSARLTGLVYHVMLALGIWRLTERYGQWTAIGAGVTCGVLGSGLALIPYGWLLALTFTVWSLAAAMRSRWEVAGVLAAMAVTVRPEFVVVVVLVLAVLASSSREAARRCVTGAVIGAVPLGVHLWMAGGDLVRDVVVDRIGRNTRQPMSGSFADWLGLTMLLLMIAALVLAAVRARNRSDTAVALLVLALMPQVLQRTDREHILFVLVVALPLGAACVLLMLRQGFSTSRLSRDRGAQALTLSSVTAALMGAILAVAMPSPGIAKVGSRSMPTPDRSIALQLDAVAKAIGQVTGPHGKFLVGTVDMSQPAITPTYLYFLLPGQIPDAYFLELAPGVSERPGSELLNDIEGADVLVLTRFNPTQRRALFPYLSRGSSVTDNYVDKNFCLIRELSGFRIYARCASGTVTTSAS